jgi:Cys-rich protein (TIGR01571 family)
MEPPMKPAQNGQSGDVETIPPVMGVVTQPAPAWSPYLPQYAPYTQPYPAPNLAPYPYNGGLGQPTYVIAVMPQSDLHRPMVSQHMPIVQPGFTVGFCSCNDPRTQPNNTPLNALLCPYCTLGRQLNTVAGVSNSPFHWVCALAAIGDLASLILPLVTMDYLFVTWIINGLCLLNIVTRSRVRSRLNIAPNTCDDVLVSWIPPLPLCAVAQQQTELKLHGVNPGAFCEPVPLAPPLQVAMR